MQRTKPPKRRSTLSHFPDSDAPLAPEHTRVKRWLVPIMLMLSAVMMALAWLGHLRFEDDWSFWTALAASWALVLPEYALNTAATRWGYGVFSGAQMASIHLSSGVVCVALVSAVVLEEPITLRQLVGYAVLLAAIFLIFSPSSAPEQEPEP
ncbi:MAG: DMT family protein [Myxococcota bacterium]